MKLKRKTLTYIRKILAYPILCAWVLLMHWLVYALNSVPGDATETVEFACLIIFFPVLLIAYGPFSYVLTKRILLPHILFLILLCIPYCVTVERFDLIIELRALGISIVATVIPIIAALITMVFVKSITRAIQEYKKEKKEESNEEKAQTERDSTS